MDILEIDGVEMFFDKKAVLTGIYLKAETGKITGILGSNGCGKSTLLRIIFGELNPKIKSLRINGKMIVKPLLSFGDIKYLPQFNFLPKSLKLSTLFPLFDIDLEDFLNDFCDLIHLKEQKFKHLSGGERRIIETYIILNSSSKFVLLDEPFSHIAPIHIEKIIKLIHQEKQHKAIILTDHMYKYIIDLSDSLYLLKDGWTKKVENLKDLELFQYARI